MLFSNAIAAALCLVLLGAAVYAFRRSPAALIFVAILAVGGPLKAIYYDLGILRKQLDCYPFSLTPFNSLHALFDVGVVLAFLLVWFHRPPDIPHNVHCERLRLWAVLVFLVYAMWRAPDALENIRRSGFENHARATLTTNPIKSALISGQLVWAVATAVLIVRLRSYWTRALVFGVFAACSLGASSFERSEVVACLICIAVITVRRLRPRLAISVLATGVVAGAIGAYTRGPDAFGSQKLTNQIFADIQFLDQSISYVDRYGATLLAPTQPAAFAESFYYGFIPRTFYPTKPPVYGNHQVEVVLAPNTFASAELFERKGESQGFFPVATWIEMFADFGLPFGVLLLGGLAWLLRLTLNAARTNVYAWLFTLTITSNALGFFRGGSNWLMMNLKSTALFALTYAPVAWLLARRERALAARRLQSSTPPGADA
jgi:hypothetical protein